MEQARSHEWLHKPMPSLSSRTYTVATNSLVADTIKKKKKKKRKKKIKRKKKTRRENNLTTSQFEVNDEGSDDLVDLLTMLKQAGYEYASKLLEGGYTSIQVRIATPA
jgi:hypothetical protein